MKGILDLSRLLLIGQLCLPCIRIFLVEFHRCRLLPFCKDGQFHLLVAACEFRHRIEGLLLIIIRELMNPHDIKCIEQLPAGRIRSMMAVCELFIQDLHAR